MRGEHRIQDDIEEVRRGSSPRARGAPARGSQWGPRGWDHPRVRGEHNGDPEAKSSYRGSSPRARGAPRPGRPAHRGAGIIPACAGSTAALARGTDAREDHPRVRGEHRRRAGRPGQPQGSSPRARGAPRPPRLPGTGAGIIPACAGSTGTGGRSLVSTGDHPRVRGEHGVCEDFATCALGSSPRARGARQRRHLLHGCAGIIPACAGSTWCFRRSHRVGGDHPRVRGEHPYRDLADLVPVGSSPRARGAPTGEPYLDRAVRIIPACAGSTSSGCSPG